MFNRDRKILLNLVDGTGKIPNILTRINLDIDNNRKEITDLLQRVHKIETIIGVGDYEYVTKLEKKKEDWKK